MPSGRFSRGQRTCSLILLLNLTSLAFASPPPKRLPLPAAAHLHIGKKTVQPSSAGAEMCRAYTITQRQLRHEFATYRVVTDQEKHDLYQVAPCFVEGTVVVGGKTFTWTENPGGWLSTTYPDGVQKTLGTTDPAMLDTTQ